MKTASWMALSMAWLVGASPGQAADLTVSIEGAVSRNGMVTVGLFDHNSDFPKTPRIGQRVSLADPTPPGPALVVFKNLAPGRYAISTYHDENGNQQLDRGLFGIPKERYGFSREARGTGGPPEFRDAAFEVKDADLQLHIKLR